MKYNVRIRLWSFDESQYGQVEYEEITVDSNENDYQLFLYGYSSDYNWRTLVTTFFINDIKNYCKSKKLSSGFNVFG